MRPFTGLEVPPLGALGVRARRLVKSRSATGWAALEAAVPAFAVYALTLLPGVSAADWAEMQKAPPSTSRIRQAIPHSPSSGSCGASCPSARLASA